MSEPQYIRDASTNYCAALVEPAHSSRREQVRWRVRHLNLCALDRETRQDAAADPGIEWDPTERQYRIRRRGRAGTRCATAVQSDPSARRRQPSCIRSGGPRQWPEGRGAEKFGGPQTEDRR